MRFAVALPEHSLVCMSICFNSCTIRWGKKESAKSLQIGAVVLLADLVIATYVCNR